MVQWLRPHAPSVGDMGLTPGQGTKIPGLKNNRVCKLRVFTRQLTYKFLGHVA